MARAAVADLPIPQHLATKEDLLQVKVEINDRIGKVETGIANLRADVKTEIANFRASLYWTAWILGGSIVTVIVGILKLFP